MIPGCAGRYRFVKFVGQGAFSKIAVAEDLKLHKEVAVKILDRRQIWENGLLEYTERELRLIQRMNHPSLPAVQDIIYDESSIMIVMEYLPNGTIIDSLNNKIFMTLNERIEICYKILEGIAYMHERGIAHRDIKPENIVFDLDNNPKIVDFGFSCDHCDNKRTFCGTPVYMAPEIILRKNYHAMKADIWSFGVTAHIILTMAFPFKFINKAKYFKDIKNCSLEKYNLCPRLLGKYIDMCLEYDPSKRPTASELLALFSRFLDDKSPKVSNTCKNVTNKIKVPQLNVQSKINNNHFKTGRDIYTGLAIKAKANYRLRRVSSV